MPQPQLTEWSVCQLCGRFAPRGTDDWIDAPRIATDRYPGEEGQRIVRCPRHWSEWALRHSIGRTNANRLRMKELAEMDHDGMADAFKEPFPLMDTFR